MPSLVKKTGCGGVSFLGSKKTDGCCLSFGAPPLPERNEREMKAVADVKEQEAGTALLGLPVWSSSHERKIGRSGRSFKRKATILLCTLREYCTHVLPLFLNIYITPSTLLIYLFSYFD